MPNKNITPPFFVLKSNVKEKRNTAEKALGKFTKRGRHLHFSFFSLIVFQSLSKP
jgi:hypothetical protein